MERDKSIDSLASVQSQSSAAASHGSRPNFFYSNEKEEDKSRLLL